MAVDIDIWELVIKTTCAGAVGIAGAETFRVVFHNIVHKKWLAGFRYAMQTHDFIHAAISAFILIVTAYEKAVLLKSGLLKTFFLLTFLLCILFSHIFSSSAPSPFFPLEKHWSKIRRAGAIKKSKGIRISLFTRLKSFASMMLEYFRFAWPSLIGQCFGLFIAIRWMKIYWDGWVTSQHVTSLPLLDECIWCLYVNPAVGFLLETTITIYFLVFFAFVDDLSFPQEVASRPFVLFLASNSLKSAAIIFSMYFFIDVTGSFANPFLALALQRHCFSDVRKSLQLVIVYVIGPFVGTVGYAKVIKKGKAIKKAIKKVKEIGLNWGCWLKLMLHKEGGDCGPRC